jgi:hypothetical protein
MPVYLSRLYHNRDAWGWVGLRLFNGAARRHLVTRFVVLRSFLGAYNHTLNIKISAAAAKRTFQGDYSQFFTLKYLRKLCQFALIVPSNPLVHFRQKELSYVSGSYLRACHTKYFVKQLA